MTMNIHWARPACYLTTEPTPRGQVSEGWKDGAKPGMRNPFWRRAGSAATRAEKICGSRLWYTHQVA
jgi:hypothetical protein